ncbi:MAG: elongation factor P [Planctomycetota bacterium]|jgi:elongation factor P
MLSYNEITPKKFIIHDDEPWEVIENQVSRKQANKPVNKTRLKNLISGRVVDTTFHVSDKVHEADISKKVIQYLYINQKDGGIWFSDPENPRDRFTLDATTVGPQIKYITEKTELDAKVFTDKEDTENIIGIGYPLKIELEVTEAPPNIKGDSATGGNKVVTVETGATVNAPLFINVGDRIRISTEDGSYSERAEKA